MKKLNLILTVIISLTTIISCQKEDGIMGGDNKIQQGSTSISEVSYYTATATASVNSVEGNEITQHGHCWSTEAKPEISSLHSTLGNLKESGSYTSQLENLLPNTDYNVRSFIITSYDTIYGTETSFKTLKTGKPAVTTGEITEITVNSAVCSGEAISDSGLVITEYGIVWDTLEVFTYEKSLGKEQLGDSLGTFTHTITNLVDGKSYRVKAYAVNEAGISYGEVKTFATLPITLPELSTASITELSYNSAMSGGEVISDGNAEVTARGTVWSTSISPTLEDNIGITTDGTGTGSFASQITSLQDGTTYYVRAYATNSKGTAYGEDMEFTTMQLFYVPDNNFRAYLKSIIPNAFAGESLITEHPDVLATTNISVAESNISSLEGIEYFTSLSYLYCGKNNINSLDVSKNTALTELVCPENNISILDLSNNPSLTTLFCPYNNLSSLDLSSNASLTYFSCFQNNLSSLDLSNNPSLSNLGCESNNISTLDISNNPSLTYLNCSENSISSLDLSSSPALIDLTCFSNNLSTLDLSNNISLKYLTCFRNNLNSLDVSNNTELTNLNCSENSISSLDLSNNAVLTELYCPENNLSSLDVSNNAALSVLFIRTNSISSLDVSKNAVLTKLYCSKNNLTSLDVSNNINLTELTVDEVIKCESSIIEINPTNCTYFDGSTYIEYTPGTDCGVY